MRTTRPSGEELRLWRDAGDDPGVVLLDGFHALKHALRFDAYIRVALAADKPAVLELAASLAPDLLTDLDVLLAPVPADQLRLLVPRLHPTGVAALADRPATGLAADRAAPVVLLEEPRNLGNVGAVIRLAAGAGAAGVVTTGPLDPWHPTVVRAAAGLHYATAVAAADLDDLPAGPILAFDPAGADVRSVPVPPGALLAFGSERHGLSAALKSRADHLVALPMRPQVSSYNLATSVAMALFHWMS
ncbi:TrmH family RNA methyltransferase [Hamadaea tsunoensis]|uniref:TrmH family RNA methyltransferase n=1 Tax=Hamadaea tsunoensis TaxID=53368 RepID=UPI0005517030|nr:TrmH family RNA methyltransferase [Hamadaea tsunoensis]